MVTVFSNLFLWFIIILLDVTVSTAPGTHLGRGGKSPLEVDRLLRVVMT